MGRRLIKVLGLAWLDGVLAPPAEDGGSVAKATAATVRKPARDGGLRDFTVFLTTGQKPAS